jgi:hypothetical protein
MTRLPPGRTRVLGELQAAIDASVTDPAHSQARSGLHTSQAWPRSIPQTQEVAYSPVALNSTRTVFNSVLASYASICSCDPWRSRSA